MGRVLVVEDDCLIAMELAAELQELGHVVIGPCTSVEQGIALSGDANLDAAILDIRVSDGLIYPLAEALQERHIPFVFATGYDADGVPEEFRQVPLVRKPFTAEQLMSELAALQLV